MFGNEKATVSNKREVGYALKSIKEVVQKGDFLYPQDLSEIMPRVVGNARPIEYISTDEIAQAMIIIASSCVGINKDTLFSETTRAYGFSRTGEKIYAKLENGYKYILDNPIGEEVDGKIIISKKDTADNDKRTCNHCRSIIDANDIF